MTRTSSKLSSALDRLPTGFFSSSLFIFGRYENYTCSLIDARIIYTTFNSYMYEYEYHVMNMIASFFLIDEFSTILRRYL